MNLKRIAHSALCYLLLISPLTALVYHHPLTPPEQHPREILWQQPNIPSFNELLPSWNGARPSQGRLTFFVSLQQNNLWSPWVFFGEWGCDGGQLFADKVTYPEVEAFRGAVKPTTDLAQGFQIKAIASGGASLSSLACLSASVCNLKEPRASLLTDQPLSAVLLPNVPRQSQITLRHPRYLDISLPVATCIATNAILKTNAANCSDFVASVYDGDFDCYEHWPFSAAESSTHLGNQFQVHIERLGNFSALHTHLNKGFPVVVALKGTIPGAPRPFYFPHAVCVIGYNPIEDTVLCIDSLFPNDKATFVAYPLASFMKTWNTQGNLAIIFQKTIP